MMTHDEARARLSALIDGALDAREAADVAAHLDGCASCRADLAHLRATVTMLREVDPVQVPEGFAAAVRGRLEQLGPARCSVWERAQAVLPQVRWSWKTAAVVAALVVIGIFAANLVREVVPVARLEPIREGTEARDAASRTGPRLLAPAERAVPPAQDLPISAAQPKAQPAIPPGEPMLLRRVIRTGHLALEVERFDETARRLLAIAEAAGGFVADSSFADEGGVRRGTFVLRVPAARFGDVVRQIDQLGTVQRRQVSGQDVTEEFIDLEARVRNLERQEARLLAFMDRATKIPDLMAIENEVARVRGEIERLTGRLRFLGNRVELATVQAEVSEKPKKGPGGFWDFERTLARLEAAFLNTVRQLLAAVEGLAAFAAAVLPLALLGALGWGMVRQIAIRKAGRTP